jgi:hypothetical protein
MTVMQCNWGCRPPPWHCREGRISVWWLAALAVVRELRHPTLGGNFLGAIVARSDGGGHDYTLLKGLGLWGGGRSCAAAVEAGQFLLRPGQ